MYSDLLSKKDPKTQIGVRVNSVSSGLLGDDLPIFDKIIPEAVLLPKVESALEAEQFLEMCSTLKNIENTPLVIFIESAIGLLNMKESLEVFKRTSLFNLEEWFFNWRTGVIFMTQLEKSWKAIVFGSDDYVASIGAKRSKNGEELVYARQSIVAHAKAFDCQAIDMVYIDFKDIDGLKLNSQQGADMGFTGKQVIHPNNIETVQSVYSPRNEIHEKFIFLFPMKLSLNL